MEDQHAMNFQEVTDFPPRDRPNGGNADPTPGEAAFDRVGCGVANVTRSLFQGEEGELNRTVNDARKNGPLKR